MASTTKGAPAAALTPEQQQLYQQIQEQITKDGTREELKSYLRSRLIESQWKNDLMAECQSVIFERGLQNVTVDELVHATNQKAMEGIPHKVKQTMIEHIRASLLDRADREEAEQAAQAQAQAQ